MKAVIGLVAAAALLAGEPLAGAKCARIVLEPEVLTHAADVIPGGGGVLVGYRSSTDWEKASPAGDPAFDPDWRFLVLKKRVKPKYEQLAPGLGVYRPGTIKGSKTVTVALRDGTLKVGTFKARKKAKKLALAAPDVSALALTVDGGRRWGDEITATATLAAAPPAEAVGLIVYLGDTADAPAISWANVKGSTSTSVVMFRSRSHCGGNPPGMSAPRAADLVTFAWVDQFGRLSPRSAAVKTT
jgi:hypothetical protein